MHGHPVLSLITEPPSSGYPRLGAEIQLGTVLLEYTAPPAVRSSARGSVGCGPPAVPATPAPAYPAAGKRPWSPPSPRWPREYSPVVGPRGSRPAESAVGSAGRPLTPDPPFFCYPTHPHLVIKKLTLTIG